MPTVLLASEILVASARKHWVALLRLPSKSGLVAVLGTGLVAFALLRSVVPAIVVGLVVPAGVRVAAWRSDRVILTDRRIIRISGIFTTRQAHMSLRRVTDVTTEQTPLGRMLGYAAIDIESASKHPALSRLSHLARPGRFFHALYLHVYGTEADLRPANDAETVPLPVIGPGPRRGAAHG